MAMIAVVDDDRFVRDGLEDLLASVGHRVRTYQSATQFLESGELADTSCVITDLQMPGMSGLDLQQYLSNSSRETPVIFLTGFPNDQARALALDRGALAFLSKPFEEVDLLSCLDRALDGAKHKMANPKQS